MSGAIPYFGDAYMADTRHLTLEEHGAYHLLLLIAWRSPNCALPNDDKRIAQMLGITAKKWINLKPTVLSFWMLTENGWEQKRLTKERRWVEEKRAKNSAAAEARWHSKPLENNKTSDANAPANGCAVAHADGNAPPPPPPPRKKSSEPKGSSPRPWALPPGVRLAVWTDFLTNRRRKRLVNTESTWKTFQDDLARVSLQTGIPPPELIEICTGKGWGGIYDPNEREQSHERPDNPTAIALQRVTAALARQ
jgi:uncharacterized protein YdaU (DUF1376 family)